MHLNKFKETLKKRWTTMLGKKNTKIICQLYKEEEN
jgi:hypothetical protein